MDGKTKMREVFKDIFVAIVSLRRRGRNRNKGNAVGSYISSDDLEVIHCDCFVLKISCSTCSTEYATVQPNLAPSKVELLLFRRRCCCTERKKKPRYSTGKHGAKERTSRRRDDDPASADDPWHGVSFVLFCFSVRHQLKKTKRHWPRADPKCSHSLMCSFSLNLWKAFLFQVPNFCLCVRRGGVICSGAKLENVKTAWNVMFSLPSFT